MIDRLKAFFDTNIAIGRDTSADESDHRLRLACATLLVEMMYADGDVDEREQLRLRELLIDNFQLDTSEVESLVEIAHDEKAEMIDYYRFTSLINEHYDQAQKISLVEWLWRIAHADGDIDRYEEHLVRRLSELLHVPHREFMQAKHRVLG